MQWKTVDGSYEDTHSANFDVLFAGMFEKTRIVELLRNFICYSKDGKQRVKILSAYHQFYAVRKAVLSTVKAAETDGRGGVFWHTPGQRKVIVDGLFSPSSCAGDVVADDCRADRP